MTVYTGTPSTLVSGDTSALVTKFNDHRDALKAVSEAWTSFGTGANWTASTTPPALGDGTWVGRYRQVGKAVDFWVRITMGSTTTFGTGTYQLILPVAPFASHPCHFDVVYTDTGTATYRGVTGSLTASTKVNLLLDNSFAAGALTVATPTAPFTFANTDIIEVSGSYEAA